MERATAASGRVERGRQDRATLDALHAQVLGGDARAAERLCARLMVIIRPRVRRARSIVDAHDLETAVEDAVLAYLVHPAGYDPRRGALADWLTANAVNRMRDAARSRARVAVRERPCGVDLADLGGGRPFQRGDDPEAREHWIAARSELLMGVARTDRELAFIRARLAGLSREDQAAALGVMRLPPKEQRKRMNDVWELLARRLDRRGLRAPRRRR